MKPTIIQILGFARAGKDWTASQLKSYFESQGKSVEVMSYAAPMKSIVSTMFDITKSQLDEFKNNPNDYLVNVADPYDGTVESSTNFRRILQNFGNEAMKSEFGDSVWADLMLKNINQSTADIVIIPDCRFEVELSIVGGITVRVINNDLTPMNHASETELLHFQCDLSINNTGHQASSEFIERLGERIISENM